MAIHYQFRQFYFFIVADKIMTLKLHIILVTLLNVSLLLIESFQLFCILSSSVSEDA